MDIVRKVLALFPADEKVRLAGIVVAMIVTGLLQTAGIASIMPFLAVVSNPTAVTENPYLSSAYELLGFQSTQGFLVALGVLFVVVMVASNGFLMFTTWATVRFQWRNHERITLRLLEVYLEAPYSYHLDQNSANLASNLLGEVRRVISSVFMPCANILARGISSLFIVALLVAIDPLLALTVSFALGGAYATIYLLVRRRQKALGEQEVRSKRERFKIANEAFGGIKDMKVLGREGYFVHRFEAPSAEYAQANSANAVVGLVPRFALETLAYGGIVVVILYLLQTRESLDQIIPLLAVYAFGANRLMPAIQEIFLSLTQIQFASMGLHELHEDLERDFGGRGVSVESPAEVAALTVREGIHLIDVSYRYPGASTNAIESVSLDIPANATVGVVGTTGAGKTTLVDLLLGLLEPTQGHIVADDTRLESARLPAWRRSVGYVPQSIFLSDASIANNIAFGIPEDLLDMDAIRSAARAAHLDEFVGSLEDGYDTLVGERGIRLSGGQRQRIGIARALYHDPPVLVLDEATSALDNVTEDVVMEAIGDLSIERTIILIAHRLTTVQECDVIHLFERGRIAASGTYAELVETNSTFRAMARV